MYGGENLNAETMTVWSWIKVEKLTAKRVSINNLYFAMDWLGEYETDDKEIAQELTNAIFFIMKEINRRKKR